MKRRPYFMFLFMLPFITQAQLKEEITIKAGEDPGVVLAEHGLYLFSTFKPAIVKLKTGRSIRSSMNFHIYLNKIQFIGNHGDTLILSEPETIDSIFFDSTTFYYDAKGYHQVIDGNSEEKLVLNRRITFTYVRKGAFGQPENGAAVEAIGIVDSHFTSSKKLIVNEDIIASKRLIFLLINKANKQVPANLAGFQAVFPDKKNEIKAFSASNNINYTKAEDLLKVFRFCIRQS